MFLVSLGLVALVGTQVSFALIERTARERLCFNISNTVDPDPEWFSSVETWYYPLASRLDFYRVAHDILETDYANIQEYQLYYDSCTEWKIDSKGYTYTGFNGRTRHLKNTPVGTGTLDFQSEWSKGMVGRAYTTLTDNKTYMFTVCCYSDYQITWNVFSTTTTLDYYTVEEIFKHAESLGFKRQYFTEIRYDSCGRYKPYY